MLWNWSSNSLPTKKSQEFMEKIPDRVYQNVQDTLKKLRHQKQRTWEDTEINQWAHRGLQQTPRTKETKDTKIYIYVYIWIKNDNTKYNIGVEQKYGKLRKKNQTENLEIKSPFSLTKNTAKGIWLKHKIEIKEDTEEIIVKQLKSSETNMQKFNNAIKWTNLKIMGIEKEKRCKPKGYVLYSIKW
jgi:hypothetical protein